MSIGKALTLVIFFSSWLQISAQEASVSKESFKVWGNCDMCKSTIEKAAKSVDGVVSAKWNKNSKMMQIKFDGNKTSKIEIQTAIAASGYDVEGMKAPDEAYNNLHNCCKYKRE